MDLYDKYIIYNFVPDYESKSIIKVLGKLIKDVIIDKYLKESIQDK